MPFKGSHSRGQTGRTGTGKPSQHSMIRAGGTSGCRSWSSFCVQEVTGIVPSPCSYPVDRSAPNFKHKGSELKQGIRVHVTQLVNVSAGIHSRASQAPKPVLFPFHLTSSVKTLRDDKRRGDGLGGPGSLGCSRKQCDGSGLSAGCGSRWWAFVCLSQLGLSFLVLISLFPTSLLMPSSGSCSWPAIHNGLLPPTQGESSGPVALCSLRCAF